MSTSTAPDDNAPRLVREMGLLGRVAWRLLFAAKMAKAFLEHGENLERYPAIIASYMDIRPIYSSISTRSFVLMQLDSVISEAEADLAKKLHCRPEDVLNQ